MPGGRPTKYLTEYEEQARKLAETGATESEIAYILGIHVVTLWRWKAEHPEFCNALKCGKDVADDRVEASLYSRAVGYVAEDLDIRVIDGKVVQTEIQKMFPPDPTSMIFWLKNRRRENWTDQREDTGTDKLAEALGAIADRLPD